MKTDYSKAKIYKMESQSGLIYVGSTCELTLARRKAQHKKDYNKWKNGKRHFVTSYKLFDDGSVDIYLIESFPCNSKDELHAREAYWIKQTKCVNRYIPGRTDEQYRIDNREAIREKDRKKTSCQCGSTYRKRKIATHTKTKKHISFMEVLNKIQVHDPVLYNAIEGINRIRNYFL